MSEPNVLLSDDKNEWKLVVEGDKVTFVLNSCFDRTENEWDVASITFDKELLVAGLRQFLKTGQAEIASCSGGCLRLTRSGEFTDIIATEGCSFYLNGCKVVPDHLLAAGIL